MIRLVATLAILAPLSGCQGAGMIIGAGLQGMAEAGKSKQSTAPPAPARLTQTCYPAADSTTDGLNRICYYDCATGRAAMTVSAATMCPSTMQQ